MIADCAKSSFSIFDIISYGVFKAFLLCTLGPWIKCFYCQTCYLLYRDIDLLGSESFCKLRDEPIYWFLICILNFSVDHPQIKILGGILAQTSVVEKNYFILV